MIKSKTELKEGDIIKAIWTDGLCICGEFLYRKQGYVVLLDENGRKVVCNPSCVEFEVIKKQQ